MLRFLLLAVLLACVSAFVPPATLAQRSVVGRAASVEMGASKGNINLLKKPKAAPKKAAAKVNAAADRAAALTPRSHAAPHSRTWRAQKIDAAPTFSPPVRPTSAQAAAPQPLGAALRGFLAGNFLGDGKGGSGDAKSRAAGAKYRTDGSLIVRRAPPSARAHAAAPTPPLRYPLPRRCAAPSLRRLIRPPRRAQFPEPWKKGR